MVRRARSAVNPARHLRRSGRRLRRRFTGTLTHVRTSEKVAALTFDDGPHPVFTLQLLQILEGHSAYATFFMVGSRAAQWPDLLNRVAERRHSVGNHSWDHPWFTEINPRERRRQLRTCQRALSPHAGRLFRPPGGRQDDASRRAALMMGFEVVGWSVDVRDWEARAADVMADELVEKIRPGAIVLLHDNVIDATSPGPADRTALLEAVAATLRRLPGYRFVTVPTLMRLGRPQRGEWTHA